MVKMAVGMNFPAAIFFVHHSFGSMYYEPNMPFHKVWLPKNGMRLGYPARIVSTFFT